MAIQQMFLGITGAADTSFGTPWDLPYGSVEFDGSDDTLYIANHADLELGSETNWTVEFWFKKRADNGDWRVVVGKGQYEWYIETFSNGNLKFLWVDESNSTWTGDPDIATGLSLNTWYHISLNRNGNDLKAYVDGIQSYSGAITGNIRAGGGTFSLGGWYHGSGLYTNCIISNFRIVKGTTVYKSTYSPSPWQLTDVANTKLLCCSNKDSATASVVTPGTITQSGGVSAVSDTPIFNGAVHFDGSWDSCSIGPNSDFTMGTGDFTIECWVSKDNNQHRGIWQICDTGGGFATSNYGTTLALGYQSGVWQIYGTGNSSPSAESASFGITANQWYHAAYVRHNGVSKLYVDGVEVISRNDTYNYNGTYIGFGGYYNTSYLHHGKISNLRVVKGEALYTSNNFTPSTSPLTLVSQGATENKVGLLACNAENIYSAYISVPTGTQMQDPAFGQMYSSNPTIVGGSLDSPHSAFDAGSGTWANLTTISTSTAASVDFVFPKVLTNVTRIEAAFDSPSGSGDTRGRYNGANGGATRSGTGSGWSDIYNGGAISVSSVGYGINQNGATGTNNEILSRFRLTIGGTATILEDARPFIVPIMGDPTATDGPFGPTLYSDYAYGDFTNPAVNAFDGSLSTKAEPHDNDTVYFDFSWVNPTGTLLNYDNNSSIPTYYNQGGLAASPSLRSKPIINAFDGNSSSYCDLTYNNGQFTRLTFEKPITNVTNITIGYDGEGDPGYNGGNHVTNVSFNNGRQTVQIYNGGAITLNNLDFISQPGNGVCRLYDVTITTTTQSATELTIDGGVTANTSLEMYMAKAGSPGSADWTVNGGFLGGSVPSNDWVNVGNLLGSYPVKLKNIALHHNSGTSSVELMAIKVDGNILMDP